MALNSVDLPTLGRPTITMSGGEDTVSIVADIGIALRRAKIENPRVFRSWYKTPYTMTNQHDGKDGLPGFMIKNTA
jgi:hypothetical protein